MPALGKSTFPPSPGRLEESFCNLSWRLLPHQALPSLIQAGQNLSLLLLPMHGSPLSPQPVHAMALTLITPAAMSLPVSPLPS